MLSKRDTEAVRSVYKLLKLFKKAGYSFSLDDAEKKAQIANLYEAYLKKFDENKKFLALGGNDVSELRPLENPRYFIHRAINGADDVKRLKQVLNRKRINNYSRDGIASLVEFSNLDNPFLA